MAKTRKRSAPKPKSVVDDRPPTLAELAARVDRVAKRLRIVEDLLAGEDLTDASEEQRAGFALGALDAMDPYERKSKRLTKTR